MRSRIPALASQPTRRINRLTSAQIYGQFMRTHTIPLIASRVALSIATVLTATACGDTRLENLSTGISRDSALAIINEGATGDSLARVYRQESYLLPNPTGNVHVANVLFYSKSGVKETEDPKLPPEKTTPIVVSDGKVIGWGWTYYDSLAKANNIPVKARN